jgi:hypothetical protein
MLRHYYNDVQAIAISTADRKNVINRMFTEAASRRRLRHDHASGCLIREFGAITASKETEELTSFFEVKYDECRRRDSNFHGRPVHFGIVL